MAIPIRIAGAIDAVVDVYTLATVMLRVLAAGVGRLLWRRK